jgi:alanine racemase
VSHSSPLDLDACNAWVEVDLSAIRDNFRQLRAIVGGGGPAAGEDKPLPPMIGEAPPQAPMIGEVPPQAPMIGEVPPQAAMIGEAPPQAAMIGEDKPHLMAVVKSNAYGHGLVPVARAAVAAGATWLGVANVAEAVALRRGGINSAEIVILNPVLPAQVPAVIASNAIAVAFDHEVAEALAQAARACQGVLRVHAEVDTGLGRLSVLPEEAVAFVQGLRALSGLSVEGVYTHLADAEGLDQSHTLRQHARFSDVLTALAAQGFVPRYAHVAGSAAGMLLPELRHDIVRAGIALYGLWPSEETRLLMISREQDLNHLLHDASAQQRGVRSIAAFLRPALRLVTRIAQVKQIPTGWNVGYGCTFEARRPTQVAVLPVGYADGVDRHLSNGGTVLVRGQRVPIIGRVCMNLTMVDVTDVAEVRCGDEVVLLGHQGKAQVTAQEWAERIGTIHYEVVTRLCWDLPRVYVGAADDAESEGGDGAAPEL